jgi:hypothetical protein
MDDRWHNNLLYIVLFHNKTIVMQEQKRNQNPNAGQDQTKSNPDTNWQSQSNTDRPNSSTENKDRNSEDTEIDYPQQPRKEEEPMIGSGGQNRVTGDSRTSGSGGQQGNQGGMGNTSMSGQGDMSRQGGKGDQGGMSDQRGGKGQTGSGSDYKRNIESGSDEEDMSKLKQSQSQSDRDTKKNK